MTNKKYYEAIKDIELMGVKIVSVGDIVQVEQEGEHFLFVGHPLGRGGFSQNDLEVYFVEYPIQASTSLDTFTKLTVEFFDTDGTLTTTVIQGNIVNISFDDVTIGKATPEVPVLYSSLREPNEEVEDDMGYCDECGDSLGYDNSYWCDDCAAEQEDFDEWV